MYYRIVCKAKFWFFMAQNLVLEMEPISGEIDVEEISYVKCNFSFCSETPCDSRDFFIGSMCVFVLGPLINSFSMLKPQISFYC